MMRTLSLGLALLVVATPAWADAVLLNISADADSMAQALLQKIGERGYIADSTFGRKDPCTPCTLLGVSTQGENKLVFVSARKSRYMLTCYPVKYNIKRHKWLCAAPQQIHGYSVTLP